MLGYRVSSNLEKLEIRENKLTQGNYGKLRENDEDSGKIMSFAALSIFFCKYLAIIFLLSLY